MADEKILDDELMTDEELDKVAGGTIDESIQDFISASERGIDDFNHLAENYNQSTLIEYLDKDIRTGGNVVGKLKEMFASYGIDMQYNKNNNNTYSYNGHQITQQEAWNIIDSK